jgi:hypothetical protein
MFASCSLLLAASPRLSLGRFWKDFWSDELLALRFPRIYSFTVDTDISLYDMLECQDVDQLAAHFAISVSTQAYAELNQINDILRPLRVDEQSRLVHNTWSPSFHTGSYSSRTYYKYMFSGLQVSPVFRKLFLEEKGRAPVPFY